MLAIEMSVYRQWCLVCLIRTGTAETSMMLTRCTMLTPNTFPSATLRRYLYLFTCMLMSGEAVALTAYILFPKPAEFVSKTLVDSASMTC